MLNISHNSIAGKVDTHSFKSFSLISEVRASRVFARLLVGALILVVITLFFPWTQNIRARGNVTALKPEQRPQAIHSVIDGRIEKWFVREGQLVKAGDTLLFISEIKDDYFDPQLLDRSQQQIDAKSAAVGAYSNKVQALENQIEALDQTRLLKIRQAQNYLRQAQLKVTSDSIDYYAAVTAYDIARLQFDRAQSLYNDGIKPRTDLEEKTIKLQETQAKKVGAENKYLISQNELLNARVELNSIENQYLEKLAKAESDKFSTLSDMYDSEGQVTKLRNQYANYSRRTGMYHITAPQDGYITQAVRTGLGETVKSGEQLMTIMPARYDLAVEMYVYPMDLPLIEKGQHVRFIFDGWPSIVFSGWPNLSFGTFGGEVVAIDNFINENGKYRLLVAPDPNELPWPEGLRVGSGALGMALLKDVSIGYELWRQFNGFPPDYYKDETQTEKSAKKSS
ncbi:MAG: HlyD family efflux transporter periplasmic adaptor subunit [Bacteroidia bacterium]|nr:HlyD family efflux transporter periplasmic adaptor subunit [Bacteroidia bacterium]